VDEECKNGRNDCKGQSRYLDLITAGSPEGRKDEVLSNTVRAKASSATPALRGDG